MKEIVLSCTTRTQIDDKYYNYLNRFYWFLSNGNGESNRYATRSVCINNLWCPKRMHHDIMKLKGLEIPIGMEIDHRDRNTLNNQEYNLRITSKSVNRHNRGIFKNNTSGIKGVNFNTTCGRWLARIMINGNRKFLGYFITFEEAITARLEAEDKYKHLINPE